MIHRDLKPANVLLAPASDGEDERTRLEAGAKITDFGLARRLDTSGRTATGMIMGTPSYMAPEQAAGQGRDAGPAADVYALGAILYECLTGRPPFLAANEYQTLLRVVQEEPVAVRQLQPGVPRDLESVCLKCLNKQPRERYASAAELADDLRRFRAGEPVQARALGVGGRLLRWARRRPTAAALVTVSTAALALVAAGVTLVAVLDKQRRDADDRAATEERLRTEAEKERNTVASEKAESQRQLQLARRNLVTAQLQRVASIYQRDPEEALRLLHDYDACPIDLRDAAWRFYERSCRRWTRTQLDGLRSARALVFSTDGRSLAALDGGRVGLWDTMTGRKLKDLGPGDEGLVFSPDGQYLLATGKDGGLWDVVAGRKVASFPETGPATPVFTPDGKTLVRRGNDRTLVLVDTATGKDRATLKGLPTDVVALAVGPDGTVAALGGPDGSVRLWDLVGDKQKALLRPSRGDAAGAVLGLAFSPDGVSLAATGKGTTRVFDTGSGAERFVIPLPRTTVLSRMDANAIERFPRPPTLPEITVWWGSLLIEPQPLPAFSHDGKRLILASAGVGAEYLVQVHDAASGREILALSGKAKARSAAAVSPDGGAVAVVTDLGELRLWDVERRVERLVLRGSNDEAGAVAFSPDGKAVVWGSRDSAKLIDVDPKPWTAAAPESVELPGVVRWTLLSPDGRTALLRHTDRNEPPNQRLMVYDRIDSRARPEMTWPASDVQATTFSPDGGMLALRVQGRGVELWDVLGGKRLTTLNEFPDKLTQLAFTPDGKRLVGVTDVMFRLWDVPRREELAVFATERPVDQILFSRDGRRLAVTQKGWPRARLFDIVAVREEESFKPPFFGKPVGFSPDGKSLLLQVEQTVRRWDVETNKDRGGLPGAVGDLWTTCLSADGELFVGAWVDAHASGTTLVASDPVTGRELWRRTGRNVLLPVSDLAFSPDAQTLAVAEGFDGIVHLLDAVTGQPRAELPGPPGLVTGLLFHPDGRGLQQSSSFHAGTTREVVWDLDEGRELAVFCTTEALVTSPTTLFSPDGKSLAASDAGGTVRVWDLLTGRERAAFGELRQGGLALAGVSFSPDNRTCAVGRPGSVLLWDLAENKERGVLETQGRPETLAFSPNGEWLAVGGETDPVTVWDLVEGRLLGTKRPPEPVYQLAFTPDGRGLVVLMDKEVQVWAVDILEVRGSFPSPDSWSFSHDGRLLAGSDILDHGVRLWDVAGCRELSQHRVDEVGVLSLALSRDGRSVATGRVHGSGPLTIWDLKTGREGERFPALPRWGTVSLSPDGRLMAVGDTRGKIRVWKVTPLTSP